MPTVKPPKSSGSARSGRTTARPAKAEAEVCRKLRRLNLILALLEERHDAPLGAAPTGLASAGVSARCWPMGRNQLPLSVEPAFRSSYDARVIVAIRDNSVVRLVQTWEPAHEWRENEIDRHRPGSNRSRDRHWSSH